MAKGMSDKASHGIERRTPKANVAGWNPAGVTILYEGQPKLCFGVHWSTPGLPKSSLSMSFTSITLNHRLTTVQFEGNSKREWRSWPRIVNSPGMNYYQTALINPALESFVKTSAPPHGHIMDAGCGEGQHSRMLASFPAVKSVIGQDKSTWLLSNAVPADKVCYVKGSVSSLKAEDESLDQLYSVMTLMYVRNTAQALKEAFRVVRPGGDFVLVVKHPFLLCQDGINLKTERSYFDKQAVLHNVLPPQYPKTVSDILNQASSAGFIYINSIEPRPAKAKMNRLPKEDRDKLERWNQEPYCWMIHFKKPKSIEFFA